MDGNFVDLFWVEFLIFVSVYISSGRVFSTQSKLKRGKTRPFSVLYPKHKNKQNVRNSRILKVKTSRFYLVTTKDPK